MRYRILIALVNNGYQLKLVGESEENDRIYVFESIESLTKWLNWWLECQPKGGKLK